MADGEKNASYHRTTRLIKHYYILHLWIKYIAVSYHLKKFNSFKSTEENNSVSSNNGVHICNTLEKLLFNNKPSIVPSSPSLPQDNDGSPELPFSKYSPLLLPLPLPLTAQLFFPASSSSTIDLSLLFSTPQTSDNTSNGTYKAKVD